MPPKLIMVRYTLVMISFDAYDFFEFVKLVVPLMENVACGTMSATMAIVVAILCKQRYFQIQNQMAAMQNVIFVVRSSKNMSVKIFMKLRIRKNYF